MQKEFEELLKRVDRMLDKIPDAPRPPCPPHDYKPLREELTLYCPKCGSLKPLQ